MDAPLALEGLSLGKLVEELGTLLDDQDFEGGEELLSIAMGLMPERAAFLHFQFGKMYVQWNKMSSAVEHLSRSAEIARAAGDEELEVKRFKSCAPLAGANPNRHLEAR